MIWSLSLIVKSLTNAMFWSLKLMILPLDVYDSIIKVNDDFAALNDQI